MTQKQVTKDLGLEIFGLFIDIEKADPSMNPRIYYSCMTHPLMNLSHYDTYIIIIAGNDVE